MRATDTEEPLGNAIAAVLRYRDTASVSKSRRKNKRRKLERRVAYP